ncbi:MAG: response regulator transcription factor [Deltaproteobacteria bacterium]|nr:response regulator transcription factor [Deltaproteobacteria bacterium]
MHKIKVMIVDDQLIVREGLKKLLELSNNIEVVAEADNGLECIEIIEHESPDVIFMDIKMPGINGIETTRLIRQIPSSIKIIMLTIYDDPELVTNAIHEGANGYLLKNASRDKIIRCIKHVTQDDAFLDPLVTSSVLDHFKQNKTHSTKKKVALLTIREIEVLQEIVFGLFDRQIAHKLHISEHTVRSHIKNIFRKLGVSTRSQAAVKAVSQGLIQKS